MYPESDADREAELRGRFPDILTSEDFAVLLGLEESVFKDSSGARDEIEKTCLLMVYIRRNELEHEQQQDIISSRFCALYLPSTVSRFLNPPHLTGLTRANAELFAEFKLYNAYLEMLVQVQHTPYFAKYLRSTKPIAADGRRLTRVLAERLLEQAPRLDRKMLTADRLTWYYERITASCVLLLSTLLAAFVKEVDQETVVSTVTRQGMLPWLNKWARRYSPDSELGDVSMRTQMQLSPNSGIRNEAKQVRKMLKNWDLCALPTCRKNLKANAKACGKCLTVCYCCAEHQRAHWRFPIGIQHKQLCHPTEY